MPKNKRVSCCPRKELLFIEDSRKTRTGKITAFSKKVNLAAFEKKKKVKVTTKAAAIDNPKNPAKWKMK